MPVHGTPGRDPARRAPCARPPGRRVRVHGRAGGEAAGPLRQHGTPHRQRGRPRPGDGRHQVHQLVRAQALVREDRGPGHRARSALSGTDKSDVTLRICTRAAIILSSDTDPAPAIFADVKALYDLRSSLVHGAIITQKQLEKWLVAVSTVPAPGGCSPRMRNERLIDRLRDLVRRSILMRLLLNNDGRWPLRADPPPPVDQLWTDPDVRRAMARRLAPGRRRPWRS